MNHPSDDYIEADVAALVLGEPVETIWQLCKVLGLRPKVESNQVRLSRAALGLLYSRLHPVYKPPEAA